MDNGKVERTVAQLAEQTAVALVGGWVALKESEGVADLEFWKAQALVVLSVGRMDAVMVEQTAGEWVVNWVSSAVGL